MGSPAVIILDEPTLGLDPAVRISLWQAIQSARDSTMSAFLITTHYIKEVADYLSAVKILDHGREVASGNPSALEGNFRLLLIIGGDHGGSFALGSLLRIVAACPGNWSRDESLGSFGVKRMLMRFLGVAVLQRGVWQQCPMGGAVGPRGGELPRLVVVLAGCPGCHLRG